MGESTPQGQTPRELAIAYHAVNEADRLPMDTPGRAEAIAAAEVRLNQVLKNSGMTHGEWEAWSKAQAADKQAQVAKRDQSS